MTRLLFGIVLGLALAPLCLLGWFRFGKPPVAVADKPLPLEKQMGPPALLARIAHDAKQKPPVQADEPTLVAGAEIYRDSCAACHGFHNKHTAFAGHMYPAAPQLWEPRPKSDIVGVSNDPPDATHWKIANGIRNTGMPAFKDQLTDREIWEVTLLLANANKPLPQGAVVILRPTSHPGLPALPEDLLPKP